MYSDFVNLTCSVPRREKDRNRLVFHLNAVGLSILKLSNAGGITIVHSHSTDLLRGKPVYRFGQVLILLCLHEIC